ncbi:hypothetical protein SAMN03159341_1565 [Paenibacillus sp. 1_12]|nr:hypothetical protein SAMN03159341_1565 [Paenibacillus sp. 1_12]
MVVFKSAEKPNIAAIHFNTDCFPVIFSYLVLGLIGSGCIHRKWFHLNLRICLLTAVQRQENIRIWG